MARCSPGDQVVCHIKDSVIVNVYTDEWDESRIFDIVSIYDEGYMLYIPVSLFMKDCITLTDGNYRKFNAHKKFIDSSVYYVTDHRIVSIYKKLDGMSCSDCGQFVEMAEPNQIDHTTFICWNCRTYPFYK